MSVFFTSQPVVDYATATSSDTEAYARYFNGMLQQGIYLAPSQFEAMFLSDAHTQQDLELTIAAMEQTAQ
jgi:glutamate-1-semialdehyde 2,1-aminomutase